jgi:AraC-like DNA-binding protein
LIEALVDCLAKGEVREDQSAARRHVNLMRRFRDLIEEHAGEPLFIRQVAQALGASPATLRQACEEYLGIGPKRYLLLRRLHLTHRALRQAPPHGQGARRASVTMIATRYGFWHLGRFAAAYQAIFGEAPSMTLSRS